MLSADLKHPALSDGARQIVVLQHDVLLQRLDGKILSAVAQLSHHHLQTAIIEAIHSINLIHWRRFARAKHRQLFHLTIYILQNHHPKQHAIDRKSILFIDMQIA